MFSCNGDQDEPDVISMEDFLGETGELETETEIVEDSIVVLPTGEMGLFIHKQLESFEKKGIKKVLKKIYKEVESDEEEEGWK